MRKTFSGVAFANRNVPGKRCIIFLNMINGNMRLFSDKQRQVFGIVHKWSRDYIKNLNSRVLKKVTPFYLFLTGGAGAEKSHLM